MATVSTNILTTLGASNIDAKQLTTDLVNAVKAPRQKLIDSDKKRIDAQISSAGLLKSAIDTLKSASTELGTLSNLNKLSISNTDSTVLSAAAGGNSAAIPGNYSVRVTQLAAVERRQASVTFAASTDAVSPLQATTLKLTVGSGAEKSIEIKKTTTAAQLVSAINASGAGATARLVNTGSAYVITLEGPTGATNTISASFTTPPQRSLARGDVLQSDVAFPSGSSVVDPATPAGDSTLTLSVAGTPTAISVPAGTTVDQLISSINASSAGVTASLVTSGAGYAVQLAGPVGAANTVTATFSPTPLAVFNKTQTAADDTWNFANKTQTAKDAQFSVNGIGITRASNTVNDVVDGMTFRLSRVQAGAEPDVQLGVSFDSTQLNTSISNFVQAYNLMSDFIVRATGVAKEGDDIAGTMKGNSTVKSLLSAVRSKLTAQSSSKSGSVGYWSDLGLSLDRYGVLQFDSAKFSKTFNASPTDAIRAMSNNAPAPYLYSKSPSGLAGDMAILSNQLMSTGGTLSTLNDSFTNEQKTVTTKQTKLDEEMQKMTDRYTQQFTAMNAVLAQMKTTSNNLTATFSQKNNN